MTANPDLLLTDDEIVALALEVSRPWPTALPTVAVEDEVDLLAAARRGYRSLAVRGLLGEEPDVEQLLGLVRRDAAGAAALACLYVGTSDGSRNVDAVTIDAFTSGDGWLVESLSPIGVHTFSRLTRREVEDLFRGAVDAAYTSGVAGFDLDTDEPVVWMRLLTGEDLGPEVADAVSVGRGHIRRHSGADLSAWAQDLDGARRDAEVRRVLDLTTVVVERVGTTATAVAP